MYLVLNLLNAAVVVYIILLKGVYPNYVLYIYIYIYTYIHMRTHIQLDHHRYPIRDVFLLSQRAISSGRFQDGLYLPSWLREKVGEFCRRVLLRGHRDEYHPENSALIRWQTNRAMENYHFLW